MKTHLPAVLLLLAVPAVAFAASDVVVHRDPGCGCCEKWAQAVQARLARKVVITDDPSRAGFQRRAGVPPSLSSCHTAVVDGYVFERHVPVADMKRLLATHPAGIKGLAVAGMPLGSEGMEVPGATPHPYEVIAFGSAGQRVFARH
ncbi:DUF411 domain-containing protein [Sphingomonas sp. AP4-R1]|uniref:DUF411 domain-containing protein n=1 Tax=Sphingomonas sp. AP4-R1 TaxID=2735134 RepID=UPI0014937C38|nr:DUF411 domain-containing protein [Sphingomonas sp. AP4-R1]QJU60600.1 DUF411 domain-containing protein [Sphingomonas sp. AP4-R1]